MTEVDQTPYCNDDGEVYVRIEDPHEALRIAGSVIDLHRAFSLERVHLRYTEEGDALWEEFGSSAVVEDEEDDERTQPGWKVAEL